MWTWISDIFRSILSLFDRVVYWFLELLISLFDQIASVRLFEDSTIKAFSERIFFLVSVIMIFKVSFSIIKYIINPDTFSDREQGMGKVIQNVILVLVCLACIQSIFNFAYNLQQRILDTQIIEKVVLGVDMGVSSEEQKNTKSRIPFNLLTSFIRPNVTEISELNNNNSKKMYTCNSVSTGEVGMYKEVDGEYDTEFGVCLDEITNEEPSKYIKSNGDTVQGKTGAIYNEAQNSYNYSMLLDIINHKYKTNSDYYLFEYKFVVSTAAGIFVAIMYLNFCIDLAIRAVKFGFLQLIAPIPIISMVDPKSSKSGMMSKWVNNCIGTYLGLFIRIAVVNFAIFVINLVFSNKITIASGGEAGLFLKVVILFGAIMFAKEAPKLINELTGNKLGGDFKMNPLSRVPGVNRITGAAAGLAIGGVTGAVYGQGLGRVSGLVTGGLNGARIGLNGQGIRATRDDLVRRRHAIERANANGSTFGGRTLEGFRHAFGFDTALDTISRQEDALTREEAQIANDQAEQRAIVAGNTRISDTITRMEDRARDRIINGNAGELSAEYLNRQEQINNLNSRRDAANAAHDIDAANDLTRQIVEQTQSLHNWLENGDASTTSAINQYIDGGTDGVITGMINDYNNLCNIHNQEIRETAAARHDHNTQLRTANSNFERGFMDADNRVEQIREERRELEEQRRVAQANMDAINNRPPHGGGGRPH